MEDPVVFRGRAWRMCRNWAVLAASCSTGLLGVAALAATDVLGRGPLAAFVGVVGVVALFASPFLVAYTWFASPRPVLREGDVVTGPEGVELAGRRLLARRAIRAGFTIPHERGVRVQLERRLFRPVELVVPTPGEARDLLRSLGLDASQTAASVPLRSLAALDWRRFIPGFSLAFLVFGSVFAAMLTGSGAAAGAVSLLALAIFVVGVAMLWMKGRATVASDGVLVSFLWQRRFHPYASIARVVPTYLGYKTVALVLKNGETEHLPIPRAWSHEQEMTDAQRLASRIQAAMAEHRAAPGEADLAALARRDRPVREWVVHLLGVGVGSNADHRRAPVPVDRLWRIVESPTEQAEARAAAAVALGGASDERTRLRLRSIASNTAAPRLRIALEAAARAAEDDRSAEAEEEIAAALEVLSSRRD